MEKRRTLSGLALTLERGSRRKQTLSEHLSLRVPGERSDVEVRLTLRQARALQKFLNDSLK